MIKGTSGGDFNAGVEHELCVAVGFGVRVGKGRCWLHCSVPKTTATKCVETSAAVTRKLNCKLPQACCCVLLSVVQSRRSAVHMCEHRGTVCCDGRDVPRG